MNDNGLKQIGENIWVIEQPSNFLGVAFGLRMTIIRNEQQQLTLHSVTPYNEERDIEIQVPGRITQFIVPNLEHTRFISQWQQRYPDAQTFSPPSSTIQHSIDLTAFKSNTLSSIPIKGIPRLREFAFFHSESKTLLLTDLAFNLNSDISLWGKCFLKMNGAYNQFTSSRILKSLIKDRSAFSSSIEQIMQWEFEQIVMAHGTPITENARERFTHSFRWAR